MLQLISGSTRRKANKCEPLLSRAGKEMELFPACTWAPGSLGGAAWIFEQHRSGGTVSLFLSGTLSPDIRLEGGGGLSPGQELRESTWETTTTTFDKKRAKLREHRGMTRTPREEEIRLTSTGGRGSRRNLGHPDEAAAASAEWKSLRQVASLGGGQTPGGRPHGTQCG